MTFPAPSFRLVRFTQGYRPEDVDAFLAEVLPQLRSGRPAVGLAERINGSVFGPTMIREGYDQDEVDDYLDVLVEAARTGVGHAATVPLTPGEATARVRALTAPGRGPDGVRFTRAGAVSSGYRIEQVDGFARRVARELAGSAPALTAQGVATTTFERQRAGYRTDLVDSWLSDLEGHLARRAPD